MAPLDGWKERRILARVMQGWLSRQEERRTFRANLESVVLELNEVASLDHIVLLCAGIESLSEFDSVSPYSSEDIEVLVNGAATAAGAVGVEVDVRRLRGLLGSLRKENLPRRIRALGEVIESLVPRDWENVVGPTQKIRNALAHGNRGLEQFMPKLSDTTRALAGMCVIWDQETSGLPFDKLSGRFGPQVIVGEEIPNLQHWES